MDTDKKKKFFTKRTVFFSILFVIIILLGSGVGYTVHLYHQTEEMVSDSHEKVGRVNETSQLRDTKVDPIEDNVSVLFIGVDDSEHRQSEMSRSDALILATFNKEDSSIKLLSIPRDSYVYIPEVNYSTKINHAHAFGGPRATIETIEAYLQVPIDYYVRMNFNAFVDVVDALGGIMYDVPYEMVESNSGDERDAIHLYPGNQHLNGEETLALARTRKYDNDIERGKRQQEILHKIADKATSASSLLKIEDVITAIGSNMRTNLSFPEMRGFLSYGLSEEVYIENVNVEGSGGYMEDGGWYYQIDEASRDQIQDELRNHLDLEMIDETNSLVEDQSRDPNAF